MVNRNLIREFDVSDEDWNLAIGDSLPDDADWLKGAKLMLIRWVDGPSYQINATSIPLPPEASSDRRMPTPIPMTHTAARAEVRR